MRRHDPIWLKAHGFDGLFHPEPCGCGVDDIAPCNDGPFKECVPAVLKDDGLFYRAPKWRTRVREAQK